jgi:hypothetical protein
VLGEVHTTPLSLSLRCLLADRLSTTNSQRGKGWSYGDGLVDTSDGRKDKGGGRGGYDYDDDYRKDDDDKKKKKKLCSKPPKKPCPEEEEEAQYEWKCLKGERSTTTRSTRTRTTTRTRSAARRSGTTPRTTRRTAGTAWMHAPLGQDDGSPPFL